MRKHLLLFLMAVFAVMLPVLVFASPPDAILSTSAAENTQFSITADVQGTTDCSILAAATLGAINDGTLARNGPEENGILTSATFAEKTANPIPAATARSAPNEFVAAVEQATMSTQNSTNPLNTNVTRSEVRVANSLAGTTTSTDQKNFAENAGTTRAPTNTVQMRC